MPRLIALALVLATLVVAPRHAAAETLVAYETVDAVDSRNNGTIRITGIRAGESAVTSTIYNLGSNDAGARCDRLALLALTKPGKFQFTIVDPNSTTGSCRLSLRTP